MNQLQGRPGEPVTGPGEDALGRDGSRPVDQGLVDQGLVDQGLVDQGLVDQGLAAADAPDRGDASVVFLRPELHLSSADRDGDGDDAAERSAVSVLESAVLESTVLESTVLESTGPVDEPDGTGARAEWRWVQEWRAGAEPPPWATGLGLTMFFALVVGVAIWVLSAGLAGRPAVAVGVNLLVAGGLAPAMWLSRDLPVLRWIAAGALLGIMAGWIAALLMLPVPTP